MIKNWNHLDISDIKEELAIWGYDNEVISALAVYGVELVEELAIAENHHITSEADLSRQFDDMIDDSGTDFGDDDVMQNEAFNDYADMLCKDGVIHTEQYNSYAYAAY